MKTKGIIYAILASMLLGTGFISVKYFFSQGMNAPTLNAAWFFFGSTFSFIIAWLITKGRIIFLVKKFWKIELMLGLANGINAIFWFKGLETLDPSVASFILRFVTIFTIILGFVFLKERFTKVESLGVGIAMLGAFIITYSGGELAFQGVIFMLLAAFFFAVHNILAKSISDDVDPMSLNAMRAMFSFFVVMTYAVVTGSVQTDKFHLFPMIAATATVTMVLGFWLFLKAIQAMEVSKVMVVRSIDPFFVMLYSFIFLHSVPHPIEIIGGIIIVIGIVILIKAHEIHNRINRIISAVMQKDYE